MKRISFIIILLLTFSNCNKKDEPNEREVIYNVAHYTQWRMPTIFAPLNEEEHLVVTKQNDKQVHYFRMTEIEGFTYQVGNKYELLVKEIHIVAPPADGSSVRYVLSKIISKENIN